MQVQIYEKSSNNERKRGKRFIFCGFQGFRNEIRLWRRFFQSDFDKYLGELPFDND